MDLIFKIYCTIVLIIIFIFLIIPFSVECSFLLNKDNSEIYNSQDYYTSEEIKIIRRHDKEDAVSVFINDTPNNEYIFYSSWVSVHPETRFVKDVSGITNFLSMTESDYKKYFLTHDDCTCTSRR